MIRKDIERGGGIGEVKMAGKWSNLKLKDLKLIETFLNEAPASPVNLPKYRAVGTFRAVPTGQSCRSSRAPVLHLYLHWY